MKKAFTLLELVFVIVIIGIVAAVMIPRTKTHPVKEAAVQLLSDIRYTQHLAMTDDKFDASDVNWYKKRWQIVFGSDSNANDHKVAYTIFSDTSKNSTGDPNPAEIAVNPQNPNQLMCGGYSGANSLDITNAAFKGMKKLNLGMTYGITTLSLKGGCQNNRIFFDYQGRPMQGKQSKMIWAYSLKSTYKRLIAQECKIVLSDGIETATIVISPETGYSEILF